MKQKTTITKENCPRCNGSGTIPTDHYSFGGLYWNEKTKQVTCTECGGSGKVEISTTYTDHTQ